MPRVAWLSDLHLDHASPDAIDELTQQLREAAPDVTLIGGDIGEARNFEQFLRQLESRIPGRLLFVLGNHDYYRSSISTVREAASGSHAEGRTTWLPTAEVVQLDADTAIIGHGGWNDARSGDVEGTSVFLNDYLLIDELREVATPGVMTAELVRQLRALGDDAAQHFRRVLPAALRSASHVVALTHVPPFREACWYNGQIGDDDWAPHMTCLAVGQVLVEIMKARPDQRLTVLCGHTHGRGTAQILPNLEVQTAGAVYGRPEVQWVREVGS